MMSNNLLPSGFTDLLPPHARTRRMMMTHLLAAFEAIGAAEVFPAMMEFEESLTANASENYGKTVFRAIDPMSHKTLALRADMTQQIARIAGSALADSPRPLKLCYGGTNLRVSAGMLDPRRQLTQVGMEIFGEKNPTQSEAQILSSAMNAVKELLPNTKLTLDLALPALREAVMAQAEYAANETLADTAIRQKSLAKAKESGVPMLVELLEISGDWKAGIAALQALSPANDALKTAINDSVEAAQQLASAISSFEFDVTITLDALDSRGFGYYSNISYSLFASTISSEIGRGGRYVTENNEQAMGLTLYLDDVIEKA